MMTDLIDTNPKSKSKAKIIITSISVLVVITILCLLLYFLVYVPYTKKSSQTVVNNIVIPTATQEDVNKAVVNIVIPTATQEDVNKAVVDIVIQTQPVTQEDVNKAVVKAIELRDTAPPQVASNAHMDALILNDIKTRQDVAKQTGIPQRIYTAAEQELTLILKSVQDMFIRAKLECRNIKTDPALFEPYQTLLKTTYNFGLQNVGKMYSKYVNVPADVPAMSIFVLDMRRICFKIIRKLIRSYYPKRLQEDINTENNGPAFAQISSELPVEFEQYNTIKESVRLKSMMLHATLNKKQDYFDYSNLLVALIMNISEICFKLNQNRLKNPNMEVIYSSFIDILIDELHDLTITITRANSFIHSSDIQNDFDREYGNALYHAEVFWTTTLKETVTGYTTNLNNRQDNIDNIEKAMNACIDKFTNLQNTHTDKNILQAYDMMIVNCMETTNYYRTTLDVTLYKLKYLNILS